jgi:hypothetical protein
MIILEELVAVVAREEAGSLAGEAGEPGYAQPVEREREGLTAGQVSSGRGLGWKR